MEALYSEPTKGGILCRLCPHECLIRDGKTGICKVRRNVNGRLIAETWGYVSSMHLDPVEKKPLYHYYPGRSILSLGSVGCNMHCRCCQNWQISQVSSTKAGFKEHYTPADILKLASAETDNIGIAYTYNEPSVWFEFVMDIARLVKSSGLKNVMVSNGFISEAPMRDLLELLDAFNIDLKGFSEEFYRQFAGASLSPVLRTLKQIRNADKHLEVTCLVIPTQNDNPAEFTRMIDWIEGELGKETVLHLSRYHPAYKMDLEATSAEGLQGLLEIARRKLPYVYAGNIQWIGFQNTQCSNCGQTVIYRSGYQVKTVGLTGDGLCIHCGNKVILC